MNSVFKNFVYGLLISAVVHVLTPVPSSAESTSLKGDKSCAYGAGDCNRCVIDVQGKLNALIDSYKDANRIRFSGYAYPTEKQLLNRIDATKDEHVQSVGRIAGLGNNEYMVFTHSTASCQSNKEGALAVVRMGAGQTSKGYALGAMPHDSGKDQTVSNRTVAKVSSGNNHPGGLSVLGHYVFVAQWCQPHPNGIEDNAANLCSPGDHSSWCDVSSKKFHGDGFSVYDVSGVADNTNIDSHPPVDKYYYHAYSDSWLDGKSTTGIASVKLDNGKYMVALSKSGGKEIGFYLADSPFGPYSFKNSISVDLDGENIHDGENSTIITECNTGDLYMFHSEGYDATAGKGTDKVHLYKLVQKNDQIGLKFVSDKTFYCRGSDVDDAGDWCNFEAGVGTYVTPDGGLILYATDYHQTSHGNIRLVEFIK